MKTSNSIKEKKKDFKQAKKKNDRWYFWERSDELTKFDLYL